MDNVRGIGGITPPSSEFPKSQSTPPKGDEKKYDASSDPFHKYVMDLMGPELGKKFWTYFMNSVQEACRKAVQKAQQRATQAMKEAKNA